MSMSKAEILTLCETLVLDLESADTITRFFDDVSNLLALRSPAPMTDVDLQSITSGTATYDFPSNAIRLLSLIMEDAQIYLSSEQAFEAYANLWRADTGTPFAATLDNLKRQYTLYPKPDFDSGALAPGAGEPYGEDYPDDQLFLFFTAPRSTAIPEFIALPLALLTIAREFEYSSQHEDTEFSQYCAELGEFMLKLIGY